MKRIMTLLFVLSVGVCGVGAMVQLGEEGTPTEQLHELFAIAPASDMTEDGILDKVKELVEEGADLRSRFAELDVRPTAFHQAMHIRLYKVARYLLENGAKLNDPNPLIAQQPTTLHLAAEDGESEFVRYVLERYPELIRVKDAEGNYPSNLAAEKGHLDLAVQLAKETLATGGDHEKDLVHAASKRGQAKFIAKLLKQGLIKEDEDLELSVSRGRAGLVSELVRLGAFGNEYTVGNIFYFALMHRNNFPVVSEMLDQLYPVEKIKSTEMLNMIIRLAINNERLDLVKLVLDTGIIKELGTEHLLRAVSHSNEFYDKLLKLGGPRDYSDIKMFHHVLKQCANRPVDDYDYWVYKADYEGRLDRVRSVIDARNEQLVFLLNRVRRDGSDLDKAGLNETSPLLGAMYAANVKRLLDGGLKLNVKGTLTKPYSEHGELFPDSGKMGYPLHDATPLHAAILGFDRRDDTEAVKVILDRMSTLSADDQKSFFLQPARGTDGTNYTAIDFGINVRKPDVTSMLVEKANELGIPRGGITARSRELLKEHERNLLDEKRSITGRPERWWTVRINNLEYVNKQLREMVDTGKPLGHPGRTVPVLLKRTFAAAGITAAILLAAYLIYRKFRKKTLTEEEMDEWIRHLHELRTTDWEEYERELERLNKTVNLKQAREIFGVFEGMGGRRPNPRLVDLVGPPPYSIAQ